MVHTLPPLTQPINCVTADSLQLIEYDNRFCKLQVNVSVYSVVSAQSRLRAFHTHRHRTKKRNIFNSGLFSNISHTIKFDMECYAKSESISSFLYYIAITDSVMMDQNKNIFVSCAVLSDLIALLKHCTSNIIDLKCAKILNSLFMAEITLLP